MLNRRFMIRRRQRLAALFLAAATASAFAITMPGTATALGPRSSFYYRPSLWAPTSIQTWFQNDARHYSWGDAAYFMNWGGATYPAYSIGKPRTNHGEFEIGYKKLPHDDSMSLDQRGPLGRAGFPSEVSVKMDYTEDADDAVLAVLDVDYWTADIRRNRSKNYAAWTRMLRSDPDQDNWSTSTSTKRADLQVQLGSYRLYQSVTDTDSNATLDMIPREQSVTAFPRSMSEIRVKYFSQTYAPWVHNGDFETNESGWYVVTASGTKYCGVYNPASGNCYVYLRPTTDPAHNWLTQSFPVSSYTTNDGASSWRQLQLGSNTGKQLEATFRCPTFNSRDCIVTVYARSRAASTYQSVSYRIPRDGNWYFALADRVSGFGPQPSSGTIDLWVDGNGSKIDVDSIWMSSGL